MPFVSTNPFPSDYIKNIMNKEMMKEIKKGFLPKKVSKNDWRKFILKAKQKLSE